MQAEQPRPPAWPQRGVLILAGPSGSGKGTLAARLLAGGVVRQHVSMGDLLRGLLAEARQEGSVRERLEGSLAGDLPPAAAGLTRVEWLERCLQGGLLVPDEWTQAVIALQLERSPTLRKERWLLDGYPRRVAAATHLLDNLGRLGIPVWRVLHLRLSEEDAAARLLARGRSDDTREAIAERYRFYSQEVVPTIDFLASRLGDERVIDLEASLRPDEVHALALARLA
jgi:adenylate kinase family enzyme